MATEKQIEANRRNAQKSTGPTTAEGKSKAKFNALKHGITADTAVLPYEDPHSYEQMRQALIDHYEPANAGEQMLVELVVVNYWRLLRVRRVEAASMKLHIDALKDRNGLSMRPGHDDDGCLAAVFSYESDNFRNLERYQTRVERSYFRAVETLAEPKTTAGATSTRQFGSVPKVRAVGASQPTATATRDAAATQVPVPSADHPVIFKAGRVNSHLVPIDTLPNSY